MEAVIYNKEGKQVGTIALSERVFGLPWNADLVHQVVVSMQSNARTPVAHVKDRGDVRGGGRKPWQQKGTGRARHGSSRSPIWVGGGVAHGPRNEKSYAKKINKKMRAKALCTVLSGKYRDGEILFVDDMTLSEIKTARAKEVLQSLSGVSGFEGLATKRRNAAYIALPEWDENTGKSFANFGNVRLDRVNYLNPLDLLKYKYLIISAPEKSLEFIGGKRA